MKKYSMPDVNEKIRLDVNEKIQQVRCEFKKYNKSDVKEEIQKIRCSDRLADRQIVTNIDIFKTFSVGKIKIGS